MRPRNRIRAHLRARGLLIPMSSTAARIPGKAGVSGRQERGQIGVGNAFVRGKKRPAGIDVVNKISRLTRRLSGAARVGLHRVADRVSEQQSRAIFREACFTFTMQRIRLRRSMRPADQAVGRPAAVSTIACMSSPVFASLFRSAARVGMECL
jgi:hypothetical protein